MNSIEKHGKAIATVLCAASFAPVAFSVMAAESGSEDSLLKAEPEKEVQFANVVVSKETDASTVAIDEAETEPEIVTAPTAAAVPASSNEMYASLKTAAADAVSTLDYSEEVYETQNAAPVTEVPDTDLKAETAVPAADDMLLAVSDTETWTEETGTENSGSLSETAPVFENIKDETVQAPVMAAPILDPEAEVPYIEQPAAQEPAAEEPVYEEPVYEEPVYEEPVYEEPVYEQPAEEPVYEEPAVEEPVYEEPVYEEPVYEEPVYEEPVYEEPVEEPVYEEPVYEEPVEEPVYEEPVYEEPAEIPSPVVDETDDLNSRIVEAALSLVGTTDGMQCTEVAALALQLAGISDAMNLWPDEFAPNYGYYTDNPQPGNLIYYNNGGRGVDHIAIYIGNGQAVHGNYSIDGVSYTVIAGIEVAEGGTPQFIQIVE